LDLKAKILCIIQALLSLPIVKHILAICIYVSRIILLAAQAKERIHKLVKSGVESGAKLLLDGRNIVVAFINILIESNVTTNFSCSNEFIHA